MFPSDPKKIQTLIRKIERRFEKDENFRDGSGSRFLLGPLYLLKGDIQGALRSYNWFEERFSDSTDEPSAAHCWALTMHRTGNDEEALYRLRRTHLANPYMIPHILAIPHQQPQIWHGSSWQHEDYAVEGPAEFTSLWSQDEKAWLNTVWISKVFKVFVSLHTDLSAQLDRENVGPKRSELVERLYSLGERPKIRSHLELVKPDGNIN